MAEIDDKNKAYEYFLSAATDDAQKERLEAAFNSSLRDFTYTAATELALRCPPNWTECSDGSCVPPGGVCPE